MTATHNLHSETRRRGPRLFCRHSLGRVTAGLSEIPPQGVLYLGIKSGLCPLLRLLVRLAIGDVVHR